MSKNPAASDRRPSHARRSRPAEPEIPQPSFSERARTLLDRQATGYLSTHSRRHAGFPFGSVMPYALDDLGRPSFLISKMAMHTRNLDADPRASLLVPEESVARDPLGAGRVTLVGNAEPVPADELETVREAYLARHEKARYWVDYGDFGFYRLEVVGVYFVGGFGVMGWVESQDYGSAEPDPLAVDAPAIIEHMNNDHADALVLLAADRAGLTASSAQMTAVDRLGFHLKLMIGDRYKGCRIAFTREARTPGETRAVLVEMVKAARAKPS